MAEFKLLQQSILFSAVAPDLLQAATDDKDPGFSQLFQTVAALHLTCKRGVLTTLFYRCSKLAVAALSLGGGATATPPEPSGNHL